MGEQLDLFPDLVPEVEDAGHSPKVVEHEAEHGESHDRKDGPSNVGVE